MSDTDLRDLGFETAAHILTSIGGADLRVAACDQDFAAFWSNPIAPSAELCRVLRSHAEGLADGATLASLRTGGAALAAHSIVDHTGTVGGWLIVWDDAPGSGVDSDDRWKRVEETLGRVATMLSREWRLAKELSGAVEELGQRYEELNVVYEMERRARGGDAHRRAVRAMLDGLAENLRIDVALFVTRDGDELVSVGREREIANLDLVTVEMRGKIWRFLQASRQPLVINDPGDDRRAYLLTNMPFRLLAVPSPGCESAEGALILLKHFDEPDFTNSDMSLARVFFGQAMMLLRNEALVAKMQTFTRQIASSLVETVEAKDPYTRGHSERVELITEGLADSIGGFEKDRNDLLWGALLHDIGKIGIPDAILMKPGRLTQDEYTFIKTHPQRSFEILSHVEQLGPAALDGARFHQEKFDGTGYPFGLRGTEIPLAARVVAVADTYDAITSSRSYRAALSHERAVEIIRESAGEQLDPELVGAFLRRIDSDPAWLAAIRPSHSGMIEG